MNTIYEEKSNAYWFGIAGLCCVFIGVGLCRFSYTPILPYLIEARWLTKPQANFAGTANFIGYMIGALCSKFLIKNTNKVAIIKYSIFGCVIGLFASIYNLGYIWLLSWRLVIGFLGALLMVVTPSVILSNVSAQVKGLTSGIIFSGVGIGIIISAIITPLIYTTFNLYSVSVSFFLLSFIAGLMAKKFLPKRLPTQNNFSINETFKSPLIIPAKRSIFFIGSAYFLCGIGFIPHSLFWVEYIKEKNLPTYVGSTIWSLFGLGFLLGGIFLGKMGDRIGNHKTLLLIYCLSALSVGSLLISQNIYIFASSAFLTGLFMAGVLTLTSARIAELVGLNFHALIWGRMTLLYATSQAVGAYIMSSLINNKINYDACIFVASFLFFISALCIFLSNKNSLQKRAAC